MYFGELKQFKWKLRNFHQKHFRDFYLKIYDQSDLAPVTKINPHNLYYLLKITIQFFELVTILHRNPVGTRRISHRKIIFYTKRHI